MAHVSGRAAHRVCAYQPPLMPPKYQLTYDFSLFNLTGKR